MSRLKFLAYPGLWMVLFAAVYCVTKVPAATRAGTFAMLCLMAVAASELAAVASGIADRHLNRREGARLLTAIGCLLVAFFGIGPEGVASTIASVAGSLLFGIGLTVSYAIATNR